VAVNTSLLTSLDTISAKSDPMEELNSTQGQGQASLKLVKSASLQTSSMALDRCFLLLAIVGLGVGVELTPEQEEKMPDFGDPLVRTHSHGKRTLCLLRCPFQVWVAWQNILAAGTALENDNLQQKSCRRVNSGGTRFLRVTARVHAPWLSRWPRNSSAVLAAPVPWSFTKL